MNRRGLAWIALAVLVGALGVMLIQWAEDRNGQSEQAAELVENGDSGHREPDVALPSLTPKSERVGRESPAPDDAEEQASDNAEVAPEVTAEELDLIERKGESVDDYLVYREAKQAFSDYANQSEARRFVYELFEAPRGVEVLVERFEQKLRQEAPDLSEDERRQAGRAVENFYLELNKELQAAKSERGLNEAGQGTFENRAERQRRMLEMWQFMDRAVLPDLKAKYDRQIYDVVGRYPENGESFLSWSTR